MRTGAIPGSSGRVRPLRLLGDPHLAAPCAEVTEFGFELARLVEDMYATMYASGGVGLAANQIGVPLRVFVYYSPDDEDRRHLGHLVNPRLVDADGLIFRGPEGCLSLPGIEAGTPRFDRAVVEGVSVDAGPRVGGPRPVGDGVHGLSGRGGGAGTVPPATREAPWGAVA